MIWLEALRKLLPLAIFLALLLAAHLLIESWADAAYQDGHEAATADGNLALETLRGEYQALELARAQAVAADAKAAAKRLLDEQAHNDQLAADLAEQQRTHRRTTDQLIGEIARVNDLYRDALDAPPKPLPACVFTAGWVRVYDEATGAAVPTATDPGRTAAQSAEGNAAEQLDSGVSQRDVLEHHVRYAEQCRNTAAQLDLLIDAVQGAH